jgi:putative ABC transport system ATP-binding protein
MTDPQTSSRGLPVVQVESLAKLFPGPPEVPALLPCCFTIERGDYIAITGPSGSGKTTLLSLLGLLEIPTSGSYYLEGIDVAGLTDKQRAGVRARRIGFVFQAFHLVGYRSVVDNVELGLLYHGLTGKQRRNRALDVIDHVGLTNRRDGLCSQLSGGEKQRVAIARTLIREPSLVLCDEPTGNLDSASSEQVLGLIEKLHTAGLTVVMITHDPSIARRARRNLTMNDGRVSEHDRTLT